MGMSASQARFLSITARLHDLEFQAQAIDNAKLSLGNDSNAAYEEYCAGINATKYQIKVMTAGEIKNVDLTYASMVASANQPNHPMYILRDINTNNIFLPEGVIKGINGKIPETVDEFLKVVAQKYVYSGQGMTDAEALAKLQQDGYTNYWTAVYYQMAGYTDNEGNHVRGCGFEVVTGTNATDRQWVKKKVEKAEAILSIMESVKDEVGDTKVNIFSERNMAIDPNLSIVSDDLLISRAQADYEHRMENIHQKDKQLDVRLARIENEHNALKTEYETVKNLVQKNIERSYKTFNA